MSDIDTFSDIHEMLLLWGEASHRCPETLSSSSLGLVTCTIGKLRNWVKSSRLWQNEESGVDDTAPIEEYPCQECESAFSYKLPLKLHIKNNHTGKLKCDMCNFRTNTIKKIEEHEQNWENWTLGDGWKHLWFWKSKQEPKEEQAEADTTTEAEEGNSQW